MFFEIRKFPIFRRSDVWEIVLILENSRFLGDRMFWKMPKFPEIPDF